MRKGMNPSLVFDEAGNLVAIATGADACTEHECGSKPLLSRLCSAPAEDLKIVAALKAGKPVNYPNLLKSKLISQFPRELQWVDSLEPTQDAAFGFAEQPLLSSSEDLRYSSWVSPTHDNDVAGAWDERSFAIRVRGARYVTALRSFYQDLRKGHVVFAGTFFERQGRHLTGVILANTRYLTADDYAELAKAQARYESMMRLKARDDSAQLMHEMRQAAGGRGDFGHISAVWKDAVESDVLYNLNPGWQVKARYGRYTRAELKTWAAANFSYVLEPPQTAA
jgi:hypothetical protein